MSSNGAVSAKSWELLTGDVAEQKLAVNFKPVNFDVMVHVARDLLISILYDLTSARSTTKSNSAR